MGEEPYFIDVIADYIEKNVLSDDEKEFNQTVLYGRDVDMATITGAAKRFPMMSNLQVVIVKEAQNIRDILPKEKKEDKKGEKEGKNVPLLNSYLENPQKLTILVFCYKYKSIDKRTALAKLLDKHAVLFESKKLYDNKVPDWITSYLKEKKYTIDPKAAFLLAEYLGADLGKISNELEKLMITLPSGTIINASHIQNNIGISKDYNFFELQSALGKKDVLKANRIVNYFGANSKEHPFVQTITLLNSFFSKILTYHFLKDKSRSNAASALGVNPFFLSDYETAARNYSANKLKSLFSDLREYDLKSKGVGNVSTNEGELLRELVFKIMH